MKNNLFFGLQKECLTLNRSCLLVLKISNKKELLCHVYQLLLALVG